MAKTEAADNNPRPTVNKQPRRRNRFAGMAGFL